jgi:hypothetical protein
MCLSHALGQVLAALAFTEGGQTATVRRSGQDWPAVATQIYGNWRRLQRRVSGKSVFHRRLPKSDFRGACMFGKNQFPISDFFNWSEDPHSSVATITAVLA